MQIDEMIDTLQGSALAKLITNLDGVEKKEKDETSWYSLQIAHPFDEKPAHLDLIQYPDSVVFRISHVAVAKSDLALVARVAHVNDVVPLPRLCWDPEDGEVYLDWMFWGSDPDLSAVHLEKTVAHFLNVFFTERLYFFAAKLKAADLPEPVLRQVFEPIKEKVEADFLPLIQRVLRG